MPTRLKITIDDKDKVVLAPIHSTTDSTLTIELTAEMFAWSGNSKFDLDNVGFPVSDNVSQNVPEEQILHIEITGPTPILTTFCNIMFLKDEVKGLGVDALNEFDFELIIDKDLNNQKDHWNMTDESSPGAKNRVLKLSVADFGGVLDTSKIIIDDTDFDDDTGTELGLVVNRQGQKDALLNLERLLEDHLPNKYQVKYPDEFDYEKGPDADFIDSISDLGDPPSTTNPVPTNGLWAYATGSIAGKDAINFQNDNVKHIIFHLHDDNYDNFCRDKVEKWIEYLHFSGHLLGLGVKKKSEFAILAGAGGGGYEQGDVTEIEKEPGFYKGFPLIDPNLKATPDPTDDNKFKVEKIDSDKPVRFIKENIDNFRAFATGYTGSNSDIFTKEKTIKDREGNDVQVFANRKPEECFGFQPGDIYADNSGGYFYVNGGWKFGGYSKMVFDILSAQNAEEAMDLAYFGKDYEEPQSDNATRKGNPNFDHEKTPNINLQFNEVVGISRKEALDTYYGALKAATHCEWRIPGDAAGVGAKPAPKYDDPDTKDKIDKGYQLATEFITDYEEYLGVNVDSLDKTKLEEIKAKLEKWKTTRFYTSGGAWKPVIDNFLTEIDGALSLLNDDPDDDVPAWKTELAGLKNRGGVLSKKIYQKCQPDQDGFTETVFNKLKKLVKLLEEAHGTPTSNTKQELEQFISESKNNAEQKKALDIAKKVKN